MTDKLLITEEAFLGWKRCLKITNKLLDLWVTLEVGPRIIHLSFTNGKNLLKQVPEHMGKTGGDSWRFYGGHRFWHAPEDRVRTYYPDNDPVEIEKLKSGVCIRQPPEKTTGLQKELTIEMHATEPKVSVTHRLINTSKVGISAAPWALTVLTEGSVGIIPLPPRGSHEENLLPTNTLTMWAYTNLSDPRWLLGNKLLLLRHDKAAKTPQKIGINTSVGWVAGWANDTLMVKEADYSSSATYPDLNSNIELFTNPDILELETLAPLDIIAPGKDAVHKEKWSLVAEVACPQTEADAERAVNLVLQR